LIGPPSAGGAGRAEEARGGGASEEAAHARPHGGGRPIRGREPAPRIGSQVGNTQQHHRAVYTYIYI